MLGHIGINVHDLSAARSYYAKVMPLLDFELFSDTADEFAYMPAGGKRGTFLFFYPATGSVPYSRVNTRRRTSRRSGSTHST